MRTLWGWYNMKKFSNSDKLRAFMKKESARLNISVPSVYHTFFARRLLEKISAADNELLYVKGSAAETVYLGHLVRSITDIDLASLKGFDVETDFIQNILLAEDEEQIGFCMNKKPYVTPTGIYKLSCSGSFDKTKQAVGVDFQTDYDRLIEPDRRVVPAIFDEDKEFEVRVPSFEEYLAEKLCIIVESNKTDVLNTRLKDFYDIYQLHGGKYDYDKLAHYFGVMLRLRGKIALDKANTQHLDQKFVADHKGLWPGTCASYDFLDKEIDFEGAVYYTRAVLREQLQRQNLEMPDNGNIKYMLTHPGSL